MASIVLSLGFLLYYVFGVAMLVVNIDGVMALSWNKHRLSLLHPQSCLKSVLVDILESVFWPYTLWRVYERNNEIK